MKIAILASAKSEITIKWANMFKKRCNDVTIFSLPEDRPAEEEFIDGIEVRYLLLKESEGGLKKNAKALKETIAEGGFDVVNAIGADTYGLLALNAKIKFLLTVSCYDLIAADGVAKGVVKKVAKKAAGICFPSAVAMQRIIKLNKIKKVNDRVQPENFFICCPGVLTDEFSIDPCKEEGIVTFGCIKPLEDISGIDMILDAYKEMKGNTEAKTKLVIIGEGSKEAELKKKAESLGIADEVEFRGHVHRKDMNRTINSFNALLNASKVELFGIPTIEGMACGVPTIATDTEGSSELILNGVTGYTVKLGNISAFAYRMQEFANYPQNAEKMGANSRGDVDDYFDLQAATDKYLKALEYCRR